MILNNLLIDDYTNIVIVFLNNDGVLGIMILDDEWWIFGGLVLYELIVLANGGL